MIEKLLILLFVAVFADAVFAADVPLRWSPVAGASGYAIERSVDVGVTWEGRQAAPTTVTDDADGGQSVHYVYQDCPEDSFVAFRVMSLSASGGEYIREWSGAWYDHRLKPLSSPGGAGIH